MPRLRPPRRARFQCLLTALLAAAWMAATLAGCAADETPAVPRDATPPRFYLGGIQVNEPDHPAWIEALLAEGLNTVSVTDYLHQGDWDTDHVWWDDEDDEWVVSEVRTAKARGLSAVLILRVALDHAYERNNFLWHGMIMPTTDEQVHSWFDQYTRFALEWAEIAEREGVDVLMIGSEMNALASTLPVAEVPALEEYYLNEEKQDDRRAQVLAQKELIEGRNLWLREREGYDDLESYLDGRIAIERAWAGEVARRDAGAVAAINARRQLLEQRWIELIERLREVYSGRLGYAANFDQYHRVGFWQHLDVMGINAYFKLRHRILGEGETDLLYGELEAGWTDVLLTIEEFRAAHCLSEQPVIFTEMGYTYRAGSTLEPWSDTGFSLIGPEDEQQLIVWRDQPESLTERALAVRALHDAHRDLELGFLEGILYWKLSTVPSHRDVESFVLMLGEEEDDPLLPELRRFVGG